jgi:F-type H+-transporting ATPase subunit b
MQINWFTVIAQIVNFIVLVWLLKRFLYKPILKAIDEREKKIEGHIKDAEAKDALAKKEQAQFSKKNEAFDKEKQGLMDEAISETKQERQRLFQSVKKEANELRSKFEKSLAEMQESQSLHIAQKTQMEVFAIARKTLTDLSNGSLEEQLGKIFIERLNDLEKDEKQQFIEAFKSGYDGSASGQGSILISTAFDLPEKQQTDIMNAVMKIIGKETQFQFKTAPEIIGGIELQSNGYKLSWSISEYLNSLQKNISETVVEIP